MNPDYDKEEYEMLTKNTRTTNYEGYAPSDSHPVDRPSLKSLEEAEQLLETWAKYRKRKEPESLVISTNLEDVVPGFEDDEDMFGGDVEDDIRPVVNIRVSHSKPSRGAENIYKRMAKPCGICKIPMATTHLQSGNESQLCLSKSDRAVAGLTADYICSSHGVNPVVYQCKSCGPVKLAQIYTSHTGLIDGCSFCDSISEWD